MSSGLEAGLRPVTDNMDLLLAVFPPAIREGLANLQLDMTGLVEIVADLGRRPQARFVQGVYTVSDEPVTYADLDYVVERVDDFGSDNRAGIEASLHRISAIRSRSGRVVGLTARVGRAVYGVADVLADVVGEGKSILILGCPGVGKTTILREVSRVLADVHGRRVVIVDTSNEIGGDGDVPHPGIGSARRMQVIDPIHQHGVMIEAVENHMPEVVVVDEIGTETEAYAARTIAERGVALVATAHGTRLANLLANPTLSDLLGGIQSVTLSDEEARRRGSRKAVLERKARPTFDVIVEIRDRDTFVVHREVAQTVDAMLRGQIVEAELRVREASGGVRVTRRLYGGDEQDVAGVEERGGRRRGAVGRGAASRDGSGRGAASRDGSGRGEASRDGSGRGASLAANSAPRSRSGAGEARVVRADEAIEELSRGSGFGELSLAAEAGEPARGVEGEELSRGFEAGELARGVRVGEPLRCVKGEERARGVKGEGQELDGAGLEVAGSGRGDFAGRSADPGTKLAGEGAEVAARADENGEEDVSTFARYGHGNRYRHYNAPVDRSQSRVDVYLEEDGSYAVAPEPPSEAGGSDVRIYPFGISANRLKRSLAVMGVEATVVHHWEDATVVLTLERLERRRSDAVAKMRAHNVPVVALRENTTTQIQAFLEQRFARPSVRHREVAMREVLEAIATVESTGKPVDLSGVSADLRRMQQQMVVRAGLSARCVGTETRRHVRVSL